MSRIPHSAGRVRRTTTTLTAVIGAGALLVALAACEEEETGPRAQEFITGAEIVGQEATVSVREERLGAGNADGPVVTVGGEATVINGGSKLVTINSTEQFTAVRVGIESIEGSFFANEEEQPDPGQLFSYYEITLPAPANEAELVLTMAQQLPTDVFRFNYAAVGAGGEQGQTVAQEATTIAVGSGEVQVSVSWDEPSDVDLYVVDPAGEEIYYGNPESSSGGNLDLDSNSSCTIDNTNNENITFADPPPGTYTVRVNYWSSCDVERTRYVVTVQVGDQPPVIVDGELTGDGNGGGTGDGEVVTTFTVA